MEQDKRKVYRAARITMAVMCVFLLVYAGGFVFAALSVVNSLALWAKLLPPRAPVVIMAPIWASGAASLLNIVGFMGLFVMVLLLLRSIIKGGSPFTLFAAKRLKGISVLLLAMAVVSFIGDLAGLVMGRYMFSSGPAASGTVGTIGGLYSSTTIFVSAGTTLPFTQSVFLLLAVAAVVWCIALVFQYGASLQRQADETL